MKVKVGDRIYTSKEQPIMVILTEQDKVNIACMMPSATTYAEYDNKVWTVEEITKWMNEGTCDVPKH